MEILTAVSANRPLKADWAVWKVLSYSSGRKEITARDIAYETSAVKARKPLGRERERPRSCRSLLLAVAFDVAESESRE